MPFLKSLSITTAAIALTASAASAASLTITEGNNDNRKMVWGSEDLEDANSGAPGFELGTFGANDALQIHGRIVGARDAYTYTFEMEEDFNVLFDLDGYLLDADGVEGGVAGAFQTLSGLVGQQTRAGDPVEGLDAKGVKFTLAGGGDTQSRSFVTFVLAGDSAFIFIGMANTQYTLTVDGSAGPNKGAAALYDLRIEAVPLPAAGWMLLAGLGGFAAMSRRKKS